MGFYMVEVYTGFHNFTDPYNYMSQVANVVSVRTNSFMKCSTSITSWCNGTYAPRYSLGVL
jgi:hypothetical protein